MDQGESVMDDDCVQHYELEWVQEQIWELERKVEALEEEIKRLKEKKDDD